MRNLMLIVLAVFVLNIGNAQEVFADDCKNKNDGDCNHPVVIIDETVDTDDLADDAVTSIKIADGTVTTDDIADETITSADIERGAINSESILDNSINTLDIENFTVDFLDLAPDAVRSGNIVNGTIRAEDLAPGVLPNGSVNVVTVATSDGDYASISDALEAISPTPSDRYVIDVKPGVYAVASEIAMKSYVHLRGSGRDVTILEMSFCCDYILKIQSLTNVAVSGLTFKGEAGGINIRFSEPNIEDNAFHEMTIGVIVTVNEPVKKVLIKGNDFTNNDTAIVIASNSATRIDGNVIDNNYNGIQTGNFSVNEIVGNYITNNQKGILSYNESTNRIAGNVINANQTGISNYISTKITILSNSITRNDWGIGNFGSSHVVMSGNVIKENLKSGVWSDTTVVGSLINNEIAGNGSLLYSDIDINSGASPNISFNVYDSISGAPSGNYNVRSDGTAW